MFIGPSAENCSFSLERMKALEYIGQDEGIEMPNMWRCRIISVWLVALCKDLPLTCIDVEDRTGYIVRFLNWGRS